MRKSVTQVLMLIVGIVFSSNALAEGKIRTFETKLGAVNVEEVASGIDTPWAMAMLPDGSLLVTERDGRMIVVDAKDRSVHREVSGVPDVSARGQGGLLDVILDPNFEQNSTIYFTYSEPTLLRGSGTALTRATLITGDKPRLDNVDVLFSMKKKTNSGYHFGSRIVADGKGHLWFTIGDRGKEDRAQDPFDAAGSVLRITVNGDVPSDNPYADAKEALPEIWSTGHRNPQGATLNEKTGELWTLAHGARGGDEINIPQAGKNYGWPVVSYGTHYSGSKIGVGTEAPGYEQPIHYWDPSIAPSGMDFYDGDQVPEWKGSLFVGALKYQMLVRLEVDGKKIVSEENLFSGEFGRVRDVRSFPDGALWFLTDDGDGKIYRVTQAN